MGLGAEAFTILAVLEARDRISSVIERVDKVLGSFSETMTGLTDTVSAGSIKIDESLLQTASGTDAVELANAKLQASRAALADATTRQAAAEKVLLDAQKAVGDGTVADAAATTGLSDALKVLTDVQAKVAVAATAVRNAEAGQLAVMDALAVAAAKEAKAQGVAITTQDDLAAAQARGAAATGLISKLTGIGTLAVAALGYASIKAAANFQDATTHLVTDAGEQKNALAQAQAGILSLSAQTGTSANDLVNAMYHIDSAGYHVANGGLNVLKIAAEGAKVGGADLDTVSKTLVGTMNALQLGSGDAATVMNELIATVGAGDMRMQDLASSISNVVPIGAAAGISFAEMGGAIATMTSQGMSADQASQDLANTIRSMSNPTKLQITEMQQLGLNANKVQMSLGKVGLTGTIQTLFDAIASHTAGGQVFIKTLNASQNAAADANIMIKQLPGSLQAMAQGLLKGTVTAAQWSKAIKDLGVPQKEMATQFESLVKKTGQFNTQLTSGGSAAQTINAALAKLTGNSTAMNTALLVGNGRMSTFKANVATIADAAKQGSSQVANWSTIQGTFNQKMSELKTSVEAVGISIGTVLIPPATKIADVFITLATHVSTFIVQNHTLVGLVLSMAAGVMVAVGAYKTWLLVTKAWAVAQLIVNGEWEALAVMMDASPIMLIVVAVGALVGALIYCYVHFKAFRDAMSDTFHAIETAGVDTWHALEAAWRAIAKAASTLWHALQTTWNAITGAVRTVWQTITSAWDAISTITMTVWNAIADFFKKWWPLFFVILFPEIALLVAIWNHFHQDIINGAKAVWNGILGFLKDIWGVIVTVAKVVWTAIEIAIIQPVERIWAGIVRIWDAVTGWLSGVWNTIKATALAIWNGIYNSIIGPLTHAWNDVVSIGGDIASAIGNALTGAWNAVANIGSEFIQIGEDIINGIVQGIENIGSAIGSSLGNIASNALNDVTSFLGISSPSTVFRDRVGKWIPAGIAAGITKNSGTVKSALQSLSTQMPGMVPRLTSSSAGITTNFTASGSSLYGGGGNGGGGVYIDLRNSQVMGDQAMTKLANQLGRTVTTKMLAQAGVRIHA